MGSSNNGPGRRPQIPGIADLTDSHEAMPPSLLLLLAGPAGVGKTMYCRQFLVDGLLGGDYCVYTSPSLDEQGIAQGLWGIFRSYDPTTLATNLAALPNNPISSSTNVAYATCPTGPPAVPQRTFNITAVTAQKALAGITPVPNSIPPQGQLVFNDRGQPSNWISTLMGILYVRTEDLDPSTGRLKAWRKC